MIASVILATALSAQSPPELANLRVLSQPGVNVVWEGVLLGEVDDSGALLVERIPPGAYTIVLRKPGFRERTLEVTVMGGRTTDLTATLARDVEESPVAESAGTRVPEPDPRGTGTSEPRPEPVGSVTVPAGEASDREEELQEIKLETEVAAPDDAAVPLPAEGGEVSDSRLTTEGGDGGSNLVVESSGEETSSVSTVGTPGSSDTGTTTRLLLILAVTAMVVAGAVWLALGGRRVAETPVAKAATSPAAERPFQDVKRVSSAAKEPTFIEDLRRREKDLSTTRPRRAKVPREDVIDVEFSEIADSTEGD